MGNPLFDSIPIPVPGRSAFPMSHEVKFSCQIGALIPFFCQECLPGDVWKMSSEIFLRMSPMLAPVMHRMDVYTHFFKVPMRLIYEDWETFITGGKNGDGKKQDGSIAVFPQISNYCVDTTRCAPGQLLDYLGYPTWQYDSQGGEEPSSYKGLKKEDMLTSLNLSLAPLRAYHLIWNDYYRDQNLSTDIREFPIMRKGGIFDWQDINDDFPWMYLMRYRAWEKDYFTSALPWAQRGEQVTIPLADSAPITFMPGTSPSMVYSAETITSMTSGGHQSLESSTPSNLPGTVVAGTKLGSVMLHQNQGQIGRDVDVSIDNSANLRVDLSQASSVTINELRRLYAIQRFAERNAVGGARYIEQIFAHFGVLSSDARLQRPEYLGGGKSPVVISEVLQQSQTTGADSPGGASSLGDMAGRAISVGKSHSFATKCEEHCIIMGIMSVMPRSSYQQGISRFLTKFDKFDYAWPSFARLGEQEVFNYELFPTNTSDDVKTFGYQSRYAEYKFINSHVHGKFKTDLNYWHLGRVFDAPPKLNPAFITFDPREVDRIFAVQTKDATDEHCYVQIFNKVQAVRPLPKYGTPEGL